MNQLHPKAVWSFFFSSASYLLAFFLIFGIQIVIFFSETKEENPLISENYILVGLPVLVLLIIGFFVWAKLSYQFYKYALTDDGFRKELGVISKQYVTIPYEKIQNVDITRGIIDRLLGLSVLNIQTAGSSAPASSGEGRLPGLLHEDAEKLRDEIILRIKQAKNQGF
jgi:uncharacterized membrane protein YdbT with pleckstrin-like domain